MSTYWYYKCLEHDPPLISDDEFTQHTDDYAFREGVWLANTRVEWIELERRAEEAGMHLSADHDHFLRTNAMRFLRGHPKCKLGLVNEYGDEADLEAFDD